MKIMNVVHHSITRFNYQYQIQIENHQISADKKVDKIQKNYN